MIIDNMLYISATASLLVGSSLSFDKEDESSYFFVIGSGLFLIKSLLTCVKDIRFSKPERTYHYDELV